MPAKSAAQQRFWVNTISLEHVELGVAGGFTQADHGKDTRLRRLTVGDGIVFYSPRTAMRAGQPLQQFTAIGTITGNEPYQVRMSQDFRPWRLAVQFRPCTAVAAKPLVPQLSFAPRSGALGHGVSSWTVRHSGSRLHHHRRGDDPSRLAVLAGDPVGVAVGAGPAERAMPVRWIWLGDDQAAGRRRPTWHCRHGRLLNSPQCCRRRGDPRNGRCGHW